MDEKSIENVLVFHMSYKNLIAKPLHIRFNKIDGLLEFLMELDL